VALDPRWSTLTRREVDVLEAVCLGLSNTEIAGLLGITYNTTKNHVKAILAKSQCADRARLIAEAHHLGVVERRPECVGGKDDPLGSCARTSV
jgi:DNA-binding NarL/FixJ family response regulator